MEGVAPEDPREALRLRYHARRFVIYDEQLYRRSYTSPLLHCLGPSEAAEAITEVHEGMCGAHQGGRAIAQILLRQGYWWPTMQKDCSDHVRRCDRYQRYDHLIL